MAGGQGFEPRQAESESAVLPLDDPPAYRNDANKIPIQHRVSMVYGDMVLCAKSEDKELKEENDNFNQYIEKVSNRDYAESYQTCRF